MPGIEATTTHDPARRGPPPRRAGSAYVNRAQSRDLLATDVPATEESVIAATQPMMGNAFGSSVVRAACRTFPSWLGAQDDKTMASRPERFYARRTGSKPGETTSGHVPPFFPAAVARSIATAARL